MRTFPYTAASPIPIGSIDQWGRVWDGVRWRCPVGVPEAPQDGRLYGRQDATWQLGVAAVNGEATNLTVDGALSANSVDVGTTLTAADVVVANTVTAGQVGTDSSISANVILAQPFAGTNRVMVIGSPYSFGMWSDGDNLIFGYGDATGDVGTGNVPNAGLFFGQTGNLDVSGGITGQGLLINGDATLTGTLTQGCDARLKTGVHDAEEGLEVVRQLRARRYTRRGGAGHELGLIAQDVQKAAPDAVHPIGKNLLGVDITALIAILINAVNELSDRVDNLQKGERPPKADKPEKPKRRK